MLRVVFAVLLTVGILGVALPAVDTARVERSAALADGELAAFETAARDLVATGDPATRPAQAARRIVTIDVPPGSFTTARVEFVAIGGLPDRSTDVADGTTIAYRLDGSTHQRRLPVEVRALGPDGDLRPVGDPLVVRGSARVTLVLLERNGVPVVAVTDGGFDAG